MHGEVCGRDTFISITRRSWKSLPFVWVDRDWEYFIYSTPTLKPGVPYARERLRQVDGLLHVTKVMLNIFQPWVNKQPHIVSADSYFASVEACKDIKKRGLGFIGVVKTSIRGFCM